MPICEELLSQRECLRLVKEKLKSSRLEIERVEFEKPKERSGYLGDHCRVIVTVNNLEKKGKLTRESFFAKFLPDNESMRKLVEEAGFFKKEAIFYEILAPELNKYIESNVIPTCYLARDDLIVLENLDEAGFKLVKNTSGRFDYEHCKEVLRTLASFHGSSLISEERSSRRMQERYAQAMFETAFIDDVDRPNYRFVTSAVDACIALLPFIPRYHGRRDIVERARRDIPGLMAQIFQLVKADKSARNVFCHGDLWASNILFKYAEDGPAQAILLDFQTLRFCPPAHDVMSFLHIALSRPQRALLASDLLACYFTALQRELRRHGLAPDDVITESEFQRTCREHSLYACVVPIMLFPLWHMKKEVLDEVYSCPERYDKFIYLDRVSEVKEHFETDATFRGLMCDAIESLVESFVVPSL